MKLIDTRDENALHRFLPLSPFFHLKPLENEEDRKSWWWSAAYYKDETVIILPVILIFCNNLVKWADSI